MLNSCIKLANNIERPFSTGSFQYVAMEAKSVKKSAKKSVKIGKDNVLHHRQQAPQSADQPGPQKESVNPSNHHYSTYLRNSKKRIAV
jgi:hypothetical protein